MNDRGHYGKNGAYRVGQVPVYVAKESPSTGAWIVGAAAAATAVLWAGHQSRQIEQLYKSAGLPYKTFAADLKQSARAIPSRARALFGSRSAAPEVHSSKRSAR